MANGGAVNQMNNRHGTWLKRECKDGRVEESLNTLLGLSKSGYGGFGWLVKHFL